MQEVGYIIPIFYQLSKIKNSKKRVKYRIWLITIYGGEREHIVSMVFIMTKSFNDNEIHYSLTTGSLETIGLFFLSPIWQLF